MSDKLTEILHEARKSIQIYTAEHATDILPDKVVDAVVTRACGEWTAHVVLDLIETMNETIHKLQQVEADLTRLVAAANNFFIAKQQLTLPEQYEHEQVLRKVLDNCIEHQTP
jgi:hypothetical protein